MKNGNPFAQPRLGWNVQVMDAADRIQMVKKFDAAQCRAALEIDGLQATVRRALARRLKALAPAEDDDDADEAHRCA